MPNRENPLRLGIHMLTEIINGSDKYEKFYDCMKRAVQGR
jgi:hypothetical protein